MFTKVDQFSAVNERLIVNWRCSQTALSNVVSTPYYIVLLVSKRRHIAGVTYRIDTAIRSCKLCNLIFFNCTQQLLPLKNSPSAAVSVILAGEHSGSFTGLAGSFSTRNHI